MQLRGDSVQRGQLVVRSGIGDLQPSVPQRVVVDLSLSAGGGGHRFGFKGTVPA